MAKQISISFVQVAALVYGEKHFPPRTPRRWHLISELVEKCTTQALTPHAVVPMCIGANSSDKVVPFESSAELSRAKFASNFSRRSSTSILLSGHDWKLNVTRLEDGWFLYQLIHTFSDLDFAQLTPGNRRDIEDLCQSAMLKLQST